MIWRLVCKCKEMRNGFYDDPVVKEPLFIFFLTVGRDSALCSRTLEQDELSLLEV